VGRGEVAIPMNGKPKGHVLVAIILRNHTLTASHPRDRAGLFVRGSWPRTPPVLMEVEDNVSHDLLLEVGAK
jgi:hypothetical protein